MLQPVRYFRVHLGRGVLRDITVEFSQHIYMLLLDDKIFPLKDHLVSIHSNKRQLFSMVMIVALCTYNETVIQLFIPPRWDESTRVFITIFLSCKMFEWVNDECNVCIHYTLKVNDHSLHHRKS